ncbi:SDR family oxidoreductase [Mangrovimicrobium sediminis]|uniref:SDR family oxidoreductase n=1 Tax=Mangrovimicrobium sediminis TaxID=2562682 RepID=A0A4Z0LTE7_9GAMM|nr:SDR family oxidoreductase [Haliea sp. SAOS-164]TGD70477.1 SDR family oxidoreductase [Haliea sp. SAOS-164]
MSKIIVITGAGVGLGRALARRFAHDGERVVLLGRTLSKVEAAAAEIGDNAMAVGCDVGDPDSVRAAFARIGEQYPQIDVLINNAAIFEPFQVVNASDRQILGAVTTNLAGPMLCARSAIPLLAAGGQIINVTSESIALPFPHLSVYQATKAGLERFSESLRIELEDSGIRVTNVRAGAMFEEGKTWDVDMNDAMAFHQAAMAAGLNLTERPISQFESVTDVFRVLLDLPADLQTASINLHARKS